jgi:hypothetical protein
MQSLLLQNITFVHASQYPIPLTILLDPELGAHRQPLPPRDTRALFREIDRATLIAPLVE